MMQGVLIRRHTLIVGGFLVLFFFLAIHPAHAQVKKEASLTVQPELPNPGEPYTVLLDAYTLDITGARITWAVNGEEVPGTENARKITLYGPDFGETAVITASVSNSNRGAFTLRTTVVSNYIDLIIEPDTYVPDFYRGKALPSTGSMIRAIAVPLVSRDIADTYTYRWELGTAVLLGGPIRGRNVIEVPVPQYSTDVLSVSVVDQKGALVGKRSLILTPYEPEIVFYEENALRGLVERAISGNLTLIADETTIYGEPYNMAKNQRGDNQFTWSINGIPTDTKNTNPRAITLEKQAESGSANIQMRAVGGNGVPQFIEKFFSVTF